MGLIKIEFELPEFKEEVTVQVTIKRDGQIITVPPTSQKENKPTTPKVKEVKPQTGSSGNLMNLEI